MKMSVFWKILNRDTVERNRPMAFDGITVAALTNELNCRLKGAHIRKIAQPEPDELILTIQTPASRIDDDITIKRETLKLKLSANASLPLVYLTTESKTSPLTAPNFCMLLRKHLSGALITGVSQIGLERALCISLSSKNELGDDVSYSLMTEIMGKHSNIIFIDENNRIIDSIKHVNGLMSSVREVLPGKEYFIPNTMDKLSVFNISIDDWQNTIFKKPMSIARAISDSCTGISRLMAYEICYRSHIDGDSPTDALNGNERSRIMDSFRDMVKQVSEKHFTPVIYYDGNTPKEFSMQHMTMYNDLYSVNDTSPSVIVERFYSEKDSMTRLRTKSSDLNAIVSTHHERIVKKLGILKKQLKDTEKMDKFRIYGELITTYGYTDLPALPIADSTEKLTLHCVNYHDNSEVDIPIDPSISVPDNANHYYDKYNKLKRTFEAVTEQLSSAEEEYNHLESIITELSIVRREEDLLVIRKELMDYGYLKKNFGKKENKRQLSKSEPLHFISSDGYDIYVGKNNYQNEEITFKLATGSDWWFHAKKMPGSHVIVKCNGKEPPEKTFEEAAALAALFSKGKLSDKLEIDYIQKKHVKKPGGGKPGFVVYYTNYSIMASADNIKDIKPAGKDEEAFLCI